MKNEKKKGTLTVYLKFMTEFKQWPYRNTGDLWIIINWNYHEEIAFEYKGYILEMTLMMLHQEIYSKSCGGKENEFPKNLYDSINKKINLLQEYLFPEWKETQPLYLQSQFEHAKHYIQGWKWIHSKI